TALVLGLAAVLVVYAAGLITQKPSMPVDLWIVTGLCVWLGSLLFAAFGLFIGYLLPTENVMQVVGFALMLLSFGGGLFIPLSQFSPGIREAAKFTPLFGLNQLVHYPLVGGAFQWTWVANLVGWFVVFVAGAVWRFRHDTARA
ncbi:MAG: ABC transporter permease, partial [Acidimicrobiales bacterium]